MIDHASFSQQKQNPSAILELFNPDQINDKRLPEVGEGLLIYVTI